MAKDFTGQEVKARDFVVLPKALGHGFRYGVVYFADEDSVSVLAEDHRIAHAMSTDCLRVAKGLVPKATRKALFDGMMGVFHPKEPE